MLNMNLKFNGAYIVASTIYGILACKFGYRHMVSVQMLFWCAVQKYYRMRTLDTVANYKISLSALLDIAQHMPLCTEQELSIYTDVAQRHRKAVAAALAEEPDGEHRDSESRESATAFGIHHLRPEASPSARLQRPFFRMQHYYVPKDTRVLCEALWGQHLVVANLTIFTNFLSARRGVIPPPNTDDVPVGMVALTLIGYQEGVWIARFPFGMHWGDQGIGYISHEYFDRYNRDRWIIDIDECGEPPEYRQHRETVQATGNTAETGLLAVHLGEENCRGGGAKQPRGGTVRRTDTLPQRRRMCA